MQQMIKVNKGSKDDLELMKDIFWDKTGYIYIYIYTVRPWIE